MINKTNKPLAILNKKKRERRHKLLISVERRGIIIDPMGIKKNLIQDCCERLYAHKLNNLDETGQFIQRYNLQKHIQEEKTI